MPTKIMTVASITTRTVNTKYGPKPAYAAVDSLGNKIDFAFKNPAMLGLVTGGTYEIDISTGRFGDEWVKHSVVKDLSITLPSPSGGTFTITGGSIPTPKVDSPLAFPVSPSSPRMVDIRSAALNAAVRFWENRPMASEITPDEQQEMAIRTAYEFADFISGQREIKTLSKMDMAAEEPETE